MQTLEESSLSRIHQHTQDRNIGMITSNRDGKSPEQSVADNRELEKSIKAAGHGYIHVKGRYIEGYGTPNAVTKDEHSYLVMGKKGNDNGELKSFLTKQGEKWDQDLVFHKPHDSKIGSLHGTSDRADAFPKKGVQHDVGEFHANRTGEFHSKLFGRESQAPEDLKKGHTKGSGQRSFSFENDKKVAESFTIESIDDTLVIMLEDGYKPVNVGGNEVPKHKEPLIDIDVDGVKKHLTAKEVLALKKVQKEDWKVKYIDRLFNI